MKKLFALLLSLFVSRAGAFTMDDIHFWVGGGTNRMAMVIDWRGTAKVWGYRWNGKSPSVAEVVRTIDHEDHRFTIREESPAYFTFMGYDVKDTCPFWDVSNGTSSDPEAWAEKGGPIGPGSSIWKYWTVYKPISLQDGEDFLSKELKLSSVGAGGVYPKDGDWCTFSFSAGDCKMPATVQAAESPYGYRIVDSSTVDETHASPSSALGRPTTYMNDPWGGVVNPYSPPWLANEFFTVDGGEGEGFITIEFDHPVVDDPHNPYGIDLIVFGNSLAEGTSGIDYFGPTSDPKDFLLNGVGSPEPGIVEVAQNKEGPWYTFDQPFADDLFPTLGHVIDRVHPDETLFPENKYWGKTTDATIPVDPGVQWSDFINLTLEEVCNRYAGSAGGTGFDLGKLENLPADPVTGKKWIRYVRIKQGTNEETGEWTNPEVDAVADVRPMNGYDLWVTENFNWATRWDSAVSGFDAVGTNGKKNGLSYVMGYAEDDMSIPADSGLTISKFIPGGQIHVLEFKTKKPVAENSGLVVEISDDLSKWTRTFPAYEAAATTEDGVTVNRIRIPNTGKFMRLVVGE